MKSDEIDLFSRSESQKNHPLAYRMRPRVLDEFIGQDHIVGQGRLLRRAIQADQLSSLIFYGPPGTGKTTLAKVIANTTRSAFLSLNAVLSGVKEVRASIEQAREHRDLYGRKTILFVDEVHRWNKAQQDALLPWVENGTIILIGATTENPYFEVNSALVSRSRIFQLKALTERDLYRIADAAVHDAERGYGKYHISFEEGALDHLVRISNGDARTLLNAIELAVETTPERFPPEEGERIHIPLDVAEESIQKKVVLYDKEGDYHFDTISAFIKSIRGSDPDAALYWLARMIQAGEDPRFIFRRLIISASEDIGLANPLALLVAESAAAAYERIGLPEGTFPLTQATLYLASSPKSNSAMGFFDALTAVQQEQAGEVPTHLKDANRDKHSFGHGAGYLYPHAYRDHWVAQQYLPGELQGRVFYKPSAQGYEADIRDRVLRNREAQLAAMTEQDQTEVLTWSPKDRNRDRWIDRVEGGFSKALLEIRDACFQKLSLNRHDRVLILGENSAGLFLWEAYRKVPEGGVWAVVPGEKDFRILSQFMEGISEPERPVLLRSAVSEAVLRRTGEADSSVPEDILFEAISGRNILTRMSERKELINSIFLLMAKNGRLCLSETVPRWGQRLTDLVRPSLEATGVYQKAREAEEMLYNSRDNILVNWTEQDIAGYLEQSGFTSIRTERFSRSGERRITRRDLDSWFSPAGGPAAYGPFLESRLSPEDYTLLKETVYRELEGHSVPWLRSWAEISAIKSV